MKLKLNKLIFLGRKSDGHCHPHRANDGKIFSERESDEKHGVWTSKVEIDYWGVQSLDKQLTI